MAETNEMIFVPQENAEQGAAQQAAGFEDWASGVGHGEAVRKQRDSRLDASSEISLEGALGNEELIIFLIDQSGSTATNGSDYRKLAVRVAEDGQASGKRVGVYGYSSGGRYPGPKGGLQDVAGGDGLILIEYKSPDSTSLLGLDSIPAYGGGGTPTIEALEYLGQKFDPSRGGLVLVLTDGDAFDDPKEPRGPTVVADLRAAGFAVVALGDISHSSAQLTKMFTPDFTVIDGRDFDGSLVKLQHAVAEIGRPRSERSAYERYRVRVAPDHSGYSAEQLGLAGNYKQVLASTSAAELSTLHQTEMANGVYEARDEEGGVVRALHREGQWFLEPERRPFDGKPVFPVEVEDQDLIKVFDDARAKHLPRPELSEGPADAAGLAQSDDATISR